MPTRRAGCGAAIAEGRLYVLGGHWGGQAMATAECFSPSDSSWEQLSRMCARRSHCAAVTLAGSLWVAGGLDSVGVFQPTQVGGGGEAFHDEQTTHNTVEMYDLVTGCWNPWHQPMPSQVWGCAAVSCRGRLHIFGGYDGHQTKDEAAELDPRTGQWEVLPPLPTCRWGAGAAAL